MVRGVFAELIHTHLFQPLPGEKTRMVDVVQWRAPLGLAGKVSDRVVEAHLKRFLRRRAWRLKERAERDGVK